MEHSAPPDVSVIMSAYNAEAFFARAITSALAQDGPQIELIVIDDGSADGTFAAASRLAEMDRRIQPIRLPANSGPAAARNAGIEIARGEWICVLDADDAILPGRVQRLFELGRRHVVDIVVDNFWFFDSQTQATTTTAFPPTQAFRLVALEDYLGNTQASFAATDWGLLKPMFRGRFLKDKQLRYRADVRHGEDFLLMVDCLLAGGMLGVSGEPGYLYTTRSSGISRTSVDYETMVEQCAVLLNDSRIRSNRRLVRLLHGRIRGIRCLAAHHHCYRLLDLHAYGRISFELLWNVHLWRAISRNPSLGHELLGVLERKLHTLLWRPGEPPRDVAEK